MALRAGLLIAAIILLLDQATKVYVLEWLMQPPQSIPVTSFFALVLTWNRGMSFGMLNMDAAWVPWVLGGVTVAVTIALFVWLSRARGWATVLGLALVIGGALGNLIDRILYGAVVDFILLHYEGWRWPAFNVADTAITLGVIALLLVSLFAGRESPK